MKSRDLRQVKSNDWPIIISTILAASNTLVSYNNNGCARFSYFKNFHGYTLEEGELKFKDKIYVMGVNKNVQLNLSSMFK